MNILHLCHLSLNQWWKHGFWIFYLNWPSMQCFPALSEFKDISQTGEITWGWYKTSLWGMWPGESAYMTGNGMWPESPEGQRAMGATFGLQTWGSPPLPCFICTTTATPRISSVHHAPLFYTNTNYTFDPRTSYVTASIFVSFVSLILHSFHKQKFPGYIILLVTSHFSVFCALFPHGQLLAGDIFFLSLSCTVPCTILSAIIIYRICRLY